MKKNLISSPTVILDYRLAHVTCMVFQELDLECCFFVSVKKRVSSDKAEWRISYLGDQPSGCIDIAYCYRILPIQSP